MESGSYEITIGDLSNAVDFSITSSAQVGNISVGSLSQLVGVRDAIRGNPQALFVVAAGNDTQTVEGIGVFPALYGGQNSDTGNQVITVAAHHAKLERAGFSNWSSVYVDLLAPGCDIPYDVSKPGVHGTSFAAPLVSMTAAILKSFGLSQPKDVKRRLQASVDYDPNLQTESAWSGRLNIVKALSVYHDVVERSSSNQLFFGKWKRTSDLQLCEGTDFDLKFIKKVSVVNTPNGPRLRILFSDVLQHVQSHQCAMFGTGLSFLDRVGGQSTFPGPICWISCRRALPGHETSAPQ